MAFLPGPRQIIALELFEEICTELAALIRERIRTRKYWVAAYMLEIQTYSSRRLALIHLLPTRMRMRGVSVPDHHIGCCAVGRHATINPATMRAILWRPCLERRQS